MAKRSTDTARQTAARVRKSGGDCLGEIITWNMGSAGKLDHQQIKAALSAADLDPDVAREILPRHAFTRAARSMRSDRTIDKVNDGDNEIIFQFTRKFLRGQKIEFQPETFVRLNKTTGKVSCEVTSIQELAQAEVDRCTVERTTSDVTSIIQKLFDNGSADMFPIRDQGGAYFVPAEHIKFNEQIDRFVNHLGGSVVRFPIMKSKVGNASVAASIKDTMEAMIGAHNEAVDGFTLSTGKSTIEAQAEKIKATRVKLQAYADYLGRSKAALLKEVEAANKALTAKVKGLEKQRLEAPAKDGKRVFGHPVTAVIRWMGKSGWTFKTARESLDRLSIQVSDATIKTQLSAGQKGQRGAVANLSDDQIKTLTDGPAEAS